MSEILENTVDTTATPADVQPQEPNTDLQPEPNTEPEPSTPQVVEYEIDGEKVNLDTIREWKKGNLRQSDYTRKTQELAKQREEMRDALELFEYLKSNPNLVQKIRQIEEEGLTPNQEVFAKVTPEMSLMRDILARQISDDLDKAINNLRNKYGDIDETAILNQMNELGITDLSKMEFVYKGMRNDEMDEKKITEKIKNQLLQELQQNKDGTITIVSSEPPAKTSTINLTNEEKYVADQMGISYEEYAKNKI